MSAAQKFGLLAGVAMLAFACLRPSKPVSKPEAASTSRFTAEPEPEAVPSLVSLTKRALDCPNSRADVLDVLAGAPYEFSTEENQEGFFRLPHLAAAAARGKDRSEEELRKVVLQMAATGGGWPAAVRERLMMALRAPCEATACSPPLALEVDERYTAARATSSGSLHQALLSLGAMTGIPLLRERAELYRSQPASVILSSSGITQSRDCFAFRGPNASVALRLRPGQVARQLVIEQPPRWAARRVKTMPRRFAVFGAKEDSRWTNPYSEFLGHFEYVAAGPAVQAFELPSTPLEGLRVVFAGPEWGESYICLYRLKVFEDTACSGGRVASAIPRMPETSD